MGMSILVACFMRIKISLSLSLSLSLQRVLNCYCDSYNRWQQSPSCNSATPRLSALAADKERISFKLCLLVYKAINGLAPSYLNEMCTPVSTVPKLSAFRSAACGDSVVPRTRLQLGNCTFCVAGPVAWNSLPLDIRSAPTLSTFTNMLKTHLFFRSYVTNCFQTTVYKAE